MVTFDELKQLIEETVTGVNLSNINEQQSLSEAGIDSLDSFSILIKIEEVYGFEIPEDEVENLNIFNKLLDYINVHKST